MPINGSAQRAPSPSCNSIGGVHPQARSTVGTTAADALIAAVHYGDHLAAQRILRRPDLPRIAAELALRLPRPTRVLEPCGTRAAAERHIARGELVDDDCAEARRTYFRERQRRARAASGTLYATRRARADKQIDQVAIDRRIAGDLAVRLTRPERIAAVQQLLAAGLSRTDIARRLHVSGATVSGLVECLDARAEVAS